MSKNKNKKVFIYFSACFILSQKLAFESLHKITDFLTPIMNYFKGENLFLTCAVVCFSTY